MKALQVHEGTLYKLLKVFFPQEDIHVNVKKLFNIRSPITGQFLECDIWIPGHELCFEFQDSHHYVATWYNHSTQEFTQTKDSVKEELIRQKGQSLVLIPCWWDGFPESLAAAIKFQRPDVFFDIAANIPIALNPPFGYLSRVLVPEVGELMLASFPSEKFSVAGENWWMGEKYDGVRCCWVPQEKIAYTRYGKSIFLLPVLESAMPPLIFDCELWYGRGQFALSFLLVRATNVSWDYLRILSFDASAMAHQSKPFEERYSHLLAKIDCAHPFAIVAPRVMCLGEQHMKTTVDSIIAAGGEGVILRKMGSLYEPGRSHSLIKIKNSIGDKEAIVTGVGEDRSLELTLPSGISFTVPPQDVHIPTPKKGEVVSFSYQGFARRDVPVGPIVFRVRTDVLWEDLVQGEASDKQKNEVHFSASPLRHWSAQNMRKFFEKYARSINADPLLAQTWYNISSETIRQLKGGMSILGKFKGGYYHAVRYLFPEIAFDETVLYGYMIHDIRNRRKFFEDFARERGFDPYDPEHWYLQARKNIASVEGGVAALVNSKGGFIDTIQHLFPEIGLDKKIFQRHMWREEGNRRKFFELYAKQHAFDPLVAENWYQHSAESFMSVKGARRVIYHHKHSVYQALLDLFPNIGLDRTRFTDQTLWQNPKKRRKFFENYAKENEFDPLVASNWYLQPREHIMATKGVQGVLFHHDNSLPNALIELFPNIGLEHDKFKLSRWHDERNRKKFFENYAKEEGFDPLAPSNWTPRVRASLESVKAVKKIVSYHNNSVTKALIELFPDIGWKSTTKKSIYRDIRARKLFFENYAKENGFDLENPQEWYSRYASGILTEKDAIGAVYFHDNSLPKALAELFPNIGIEKAKFIAPKSRKLWNDEKNRKEFFEKFALDHEFDPLLAENWYRQSYEKILNARFVRSIVSYHNNSLLQCLANLFPEIGLDETKFPDNWFTNKRSQAHKVELVTSQNTATKKNRVIQSNQPPKTKHHVPLAAKHTRTRLTSRLLKHVSNKKKMELEHKIFGIQKDSTVALVKKSRRLVASFTSTLRKPALQIDEEKRRKFFENYARIEGFDPLIPENWYSQPLKKIMAHKGARGVIDLHKHTVARTLISVFPSIGLQKEKFTQPWWEVSEKRRQFLEHFAKLSGFDPLVPENWYTITRDRILALRGGKRLLTYHTSVRNAVLSLFPDIGLQKSKFRRPIATWSYPEDRRKFFEDFAKSQGFNPLVPDNWYNATREQIMACKGAKSILAYHQTFTQALIDLFPDIGLDPSKLFPFFAKWRDPENRREFFVDFAKANGFDPLLPAGWYSQSKSKILESKGAHRLLFYHENSIRKALLSLFPEIGLQEELLPF